MIKKARTSIQRRPSFALHKRERAGQPRFPLGRGGGYRSGKLLQCFHQLCERRGSARIHLHGN